LFWGQGPFPMVGPASSSSPPNLLFLPGKTNGNPCPLQRSRGREGLCFPHPPGGPSLFHFSCRLRMGAPPPSNKPIAPTLSICRERISSREDGPPVPVSPGRFPPPPTRPAWCSDGWFLPRPLCCPKQGLDQVPWTAFFFQRGGLDIGRISRGVKTFFRGGKRGRRRTTDRAPDPVWAPQQSQKNPRPGALKTNAPSAKNQKSTVKIQPPSSMWESKELVEFADEKMPADPFWDFPVWPGGSSAYSIWQILQVFPPLAPSKPGEGAIFKIAQTLEVPKTAAGLG